MAAARSASGGLGGRTHEIQRLIGRSLRTVTDMRALGECTVNVDCDVLQADGGTRTASITGAWIALSDAFATWREAGKIGASPLLDHVAATSVGLVDGELLLDLDYPEDSRAEVDMNVVVDGRGRFIEVQGTGERTPFDRERLDLMLDLAGRGTRRAHRRAARAAREGVADVWSMTLRRIVVATTNPGKLAEIRSALGSARMSVRDLCGPRPDGAGGGREPATPSRRTPSSRRRPTEPLTGLPALADDSGLVVDALGGRPGVRSSRFAGERADDAENNRKLLEELDGFGPEMRAARFQCVMVLLDENDETTTACGTCEGQIGMSPRGSGGFGYDPLFLPVETPGRSMAELDMREKNAISHRGKALASLRAAMSRGVIRRGRLPLARRSPYTVSRCPPHGRCSRFGP